MSDTRLLPARDGAPAPAGTLVDRFEYLRDLARGRRVVHVGFVDAGCQMLNEQSGAWLHEHLARRGASWSASTSTQAGRRASARARLRGVRGRLPRRRRGARARHRARPTWWSPARSSSTSTTRVGFLDGLHALVARGGVLVVTTPNASGFVNAAACSATRGEPPRPRGDVHLHDARRDAPPPRWEPVEHAVYLQQVKTSGTDARSRMLTTGARMVLGLERLLARLGRPYAADG